MTKGQEMIEELGFKLPELDCEENALEIFFVDKFGTIHGRFGWESIRWSKKGVSSTHPDNFNLVKVNWYDIPSNFPCLVKYGVHFKIATHRTGDEIWFGSYEWCHNSEIRFATLEEASKLVIKGGK